MCRLFFNTIALRQWFRSETFKFILGEQRYRLIKSKERYLSCSANGLYIWGTTEVRVKIGHNVTLFTNQMRFFLFAFLVRLFMYFSIIVSVIKNLDSLQLQFFIHFSWLNKKRHHLTFLCPCPYFHSCNNVF